MIYLLADIEVAPGKMQEYKDVFGGEYLTRLSQLGRKLTGAWETEIGPRNTIVDLWQFESAAHLFEIRERQAKDEKLRQLDTRLRPLISHHTLRIIKPVSFSPMQ